MNHTHPTRYGHALLCPDWRLKLRLGGGLATSEHLELLPDSWSDEHWLCESLNAWSIRGERACQTGIPGLYVMLKHFLGIHHVFWAC